MKTYRNSIWICIVTCIFSFFTMLLAKLCPTVLVVYLGVTYANAINDVLFNISLGIFCSAFVVAITYVGAYRIEKSRTIGQLILSCGDYVEELFNLFPLLADFSEKGKIKYSFEKTRCQVENSKEIHEIVQRLIRIYRESLHEREGFYPFLRSNIFNLKVHQLELHFAKLNMYIQTLSIAYQLQNNDIFKQEEEDTGYTVDKLKNALEMLLQLNGNKEYKEFLNLLKTISEQYQLLNVRDGKLEGKCL